MASEQLNLTAYCKCRLYVTFVMLIWTATRLLLSHQSWNLSMMMLGLSLRGILASLMSSLVTWQTL